MMGTNFCPSQLLPSKQMMKNIHAVTGHLGKVALVAGSIQIYRLKG